MASMAGLVLAGMSLEHLLHTCMLYKCDIIVFWGQVLVKLHPTVICLISCKLGKDTVLVTYCTINLFTLYISAVVKLYVSKSRIRDSQGLKLWLLCLVSCHNAVLVISLILQLLSSPTDTGRNSSLVWILTELAIKTVWIGLVPWFLCGMTVWSSLF